MMIITLQVTIFNMVVISIVILTLIVFVFSFTSYIDNKPKSNKIRKWWSKYITDLDDNYN